MRIDSGQVLVRWLKFYLKSLGEFATPSVLVGSWQYRVPGRELVCLSAVFSIHSDRLEECLVGLRVGLAV